MRKIPLSKLHESLGARMVEFAGWWMPVQYSAVIEEHNSVRTSAGIFDVSHMGEFLLKGRDALKFLQGLISNDLRKIPAFKAQYNILMNENGGAVDDIIIYKFSDEEFFICVNAGNIEKDFNWFKLHKPGNVELTDLSEATALFAVQGKNSPYIIAKLFPGVPEGLKVFSFAKTTFNSKEIVIARTGYTGEDGFEIFHPVELAEELWNRIISAGKEFNLKPCGLGARDTLRLEAGYPLYGHELKDDITPLEAGLERFVSFEKGEFLGKRVLEEQKKNGLKRIRAGIVMDEGIPRDGYRIFKSERQIGYVTSGTFSPTLRKGIALALIEPQENTPGNRVEVEIRDKRKSAAVTTVPFIKK
jgi:aminomethyltransferase